MTDPDELTLGCLYIEDEELPEEFQPRLIRECNWAECTNECAPDDDYCAEHVAQADAELLEIAESRMLSHFIDRVMG